MISIGANKNSFGMLYRNNVDEKNDLRPESQQNINKEIGVWSRHTHNGRAFSAVIEAAIKYFGFNPIHLGNGITR